MPMPISNRFTGDVITSTIWNNDVVDSVNSLYNGATVGWIAFPSTQNANGGANHLDDYEEGTWAPAANGATVTVTSAWYTKVGQLVTFSLNVTWPTTTNTNQASLTLPFSAAVQSAAAVGYNGSTTAAIALVQGATLFLYAPTGGTTVTNANLSGAILRIGGLFQVTS